MRACAEHGTEAWLGNQRLKGIEEHDSTSPGFCHSPDVGCLLCTGMGMFTASDCPPQWGSTFHEQTDSLGRRQGLSERVMVSGPRPRHVWLPVQSLHAPPRALQALKDLACHSSAEAKQTCHKPPQLTSVWSTLNGFWKSESFSLIPSSWAICRGGKASHPPPSPASCSPAGHSLHGGTQAQSPADMGEVMTPRNPGQHRTPWDGVSTCQGLAQKIRPSIRARLQADARLTAQCETEGSSPPAPQSLPG